MGLQLPEGLQLMLQSSADSQEEGSSALSRGSMWAGASHWRYTAPAQKAHPDSQADSKPAPSKRCILIYAIAPDVQHAYGITAEWYSRMHVV